MRLYSTYVGVLSLYSLTLKEFYAFNPSVRSGCVTMAARSYYCISINVDGSLLGDYVDPITTTLGAPITTSLGAPMATSLGAATITMNLPMTTSSGMLRL